MPLTEVGRFRDKKGRIPISEWLDDLKVHRSKIYAKCLAWISELAMKGNQLRRPFGEHLENGIYELRVKFGTQNYRMLYFFHGSNIAVLTHGFTKEDVVPPKEITFEKQCRVLVKENASKHTVDWS